MSAPVQSPPLPGLIVPVEVWMSITGKVNVLPSMNSHTEKDRPLSRQSIVGEAPLSFRSRSSDQPAAAMMSRSSSALTEHGAAFGSPQNSRSSTPQRGSSSVSFGYSRMQLTGSFGGTLGEIPP